VKHKRFESNYFKIALTMIQANGQSGKYSVFLWDVWCGCLRKFTVTSAITNGIPVFSYYQVRLDCAYKVTAYAQCCYNIFKQDMCKSWSSYRRCGVKWDV